MYNDKLLALESGFKIFQLHIITILLKNCYFKFALPIYNNLFFSDTVGFKNILTYKAILKPISLFPQDLNCSVSGRTNVQCTKCKKVDFYFFVELSQLKG